MKNIIYILQSQNILKKEFKWEICSKCNNQYIDKFIWRCGSSNPRLDIKKNIRSEFFLNLLRYSLILYII